jgi:[glutamine synthetase] adenylyltransferase / [glutamine synthetase]-adenylyl-L-tyrosine phosphorylase
MKIPMAESSDGVDNLLAHSRYARRLLDSNPDLRHELARSLATAFPIDDMRGSLPDQPGLDGASIRSALRRLRQRVLLRVMARDLAALADLTEVTSTMTDLAEVAIEFALPRLQDELLAAYGAPMGAETGQTQQLIVVAMGKLGGRELNVSSDIDLVFVYPEEGETAGPRRISNHEFFTQLGKRLIATLQEPTADGFVFRVDMRLRPYGDSGALVVSFAALDEYLISQGRPWERYAWIKARPIGGARHEELLDLVRPFVYRRYLDYSAFASLRDLHRQVRAEVARRDRLDNIKLGPGGIREIEFIAQVFQLIRGGREAGLRQRATLVTVAELARAKLIPTHAERELKNAYVFLRNLEHRLQYLDDAQTQTLPTSPQDRELVARSMGFGDFAALDAELLVHRDNVTRHFDAIFAIAPEAAPGQHCRDLWNTTLPEDEAVSQLAALGYGDAREVYRQIRAFRAGGRFQQLPEASRQRLDDLVPNLLAAGGKLTQPDRTLSSVLELLEAVSRRGAYLALLAENPQTLSKVATLASRSRWAANYLKQHPILLDELLDHRELLAPPDWPAAERELRASLEEFEPDIERQMDTLRHFKHARVFHLIAQELEGLLTVERLSDHLSEMADRLLGVTVDLCWRKLAGTHVVAPAFAVIGYGKLGGKELGYGSDVDIVFLYRDEAAEAPETYARLAQRLNTWLTSFTAAGVLYESDLRLRPDGASGLLVSSVTAFEDYQRHKAWTWEHQALTRARFCAGDPAIGAVFEALRCAILRQRRDLAALRHDILEMRAKMLAEHRAGGGFDLKQNRGGLIDVEFIVQYLVLAHAHEFSDLAANIGNIALLQRCAELGLIPAVLAQDSADAYRELRRLQHQAWMNEEKAILPPQRVEPLVKPVIELWRVVFPDESVCP